jgi:penicillin-binding protein 1A
MMNTMMRETVLIGTARNAQLPGWTVAGKTGTSQDFRDAWFIGYTGHLVTGVWLGNDDSAPTKKVTGGSLPVEIWSAFMRVAHHGVPVAGLPGPAGGPTLAAAVPTGNLAPPPAAIGGQPGGPTMRPATIDRSLDGWFIDRLFGRR